MKLEELFAKCEIAVATEELMNNIEPFSCGEKYEEDRDLTDFFLNDSKVFGENLLGKTYVLMLKDDSNVRRKVVTFFTLSNDSIRITREFNEDNKKTFLEYTGLDGKSLKRFPCVLLGRLGTDKDFQRQGYGSAIMDFIKLMFVTDNKTGCRFIIVDALNREDTLDYYDRNGFKYLISDEEKEAKYMNISKNSLPLRTRLMYFDLLTLNAGK